MVSINDDDDDETNIGSVEEASLPPIPEHVLFSEILTKLPVKSLLRFKSVSKGWSNQISSDSFAAHHITRQTAARKPSDMIIITKQYLYAESNPPVEHDMSYIGDGEVIFVGCYNGLVLFHQYPDAQSDNMNLVLWNPATKHFTQLPKPVQPVLIPGIPQRDLRGDYGLGFGKDCNNYKIVKITGLNSSDNGVDLNIQLFTKRSGCWTHLETITNALLVWNTLGGSVVDGFMHWVILRGDSPGIFTRYKILTFDLDTDELKEIDGPDLPNFEETFNFPKLTEHENFHYLYIFKWNNSLCFLNLVEDDEYHFWLKSYDSWTKMSLPKIFKSTWLFLEAFRDRFIFYDFSIEDYFLFDVVTAKESLFSEEFGKYFPHKNFQYIPSLISPSYY